MKQQNCDHWQDELPKFGYIHIREESRKKVDNSYYVFGDLMEISKYGDLKKTIPQNLVTLATFSFSFLSHKNPLYELPWIFYFDFWGHQFVII